MDVLVYRRPRSHMGTVLCPDRHFCASSEPVPSEGPGFQVISWNGRRPEPYRSKPGTWKYPEERFDPLGTYREFRV